MDVKPPSSGEVEVAGTVSPAYPESLTIADGDYLNLKAIPADGFHFVEWSEIPSVYRDDNPLRMQIVRKTRATAVFAPNQTPTPVGKGDIEIITDDSPAELYVEDSSLVVSPPPPIPQPEPSPPALSPESPSASGVSLMVVVPVIIAASLAFYLLIRLKRRGMFD